MVSDERCDPGFSDRGLILPKGPGPLCPPSGHAVWIAVINYVQTVASEDTRNPAPWSTGAPGFGLGVFLRRWNEISNQKGAS